MNCDMNKNRLLTLYFHEGSRREELKIKKHVDGCNHCREYLLTLERTDRMLQGWKEESPLPGTLNLIMANIPQKQLKPAAARPAPSLSLAPILTILLSIAAILGIISLVHEKITLLPFWETVKAWGIVRLFGPFGVTAILFFLFGIFVTLSLAPVLILELQSKKYHLKVMPKVT